MTENKDTAPTGPDPDKQAPQDEAAPEVEVMFLDRVIAFLVLVLPFSYLISKAQDLTVDRLPTSIANIMVLVGIVLFLIVVDKVSKRIYKIRKERLV
ncbi:MAG: hypothetical protein LDL33_03935 [Desulfomonile sp.]|nr:hypothetical protein [Desulfomonile sp.]